MGSLCCAREGVISCGIHVPMIMSEFASVCSTRRPGSPDATPSAKRLWSAPTCSDVWASARQAAASRRTGAVAQRRLRPRSREWLSNQLVWRHSAAQVRQRPAAPVFLYDKPRRLDRMYKNLSREVFRRRFRWFPASEAFTIGIIARQHGRGAIPCRPLRERADAFRRKSSLANTECCAKSDEEDGSTSSRP